MIPGGITNVSVPKFTCPCILIYVNYTTGYIRVSCTLLTSEMTVLILSNSLQFAHRVH